MFGQKIHQVTGSRQVRTVKKKAAMAANSDERGMPQLLQMEGQRRRRHIQLLRELTWRIALRTSLDEQAEHRQSRLLGQCSKA